MIFPPSSLSISRSLVLVLLQVSSWSRRLLLLSL